MKMMVLGNFLVMTNLTIFQKLLNWLGLDKSQKLTVHFLKLLTCQLDILLIENTKVINGLLKKINSILETHWLTKQHTTLVFIKFGAAEVQWAYLYNQAAALVRRFELLF